MPIRLPADQAGQGGDNPLFAEAMMVLASASCPFATLSGDLREALVATMRLCEFAAGELLVRQGESGDHLLVILTGTAEATLHHTWSEHTLGSALGPGDVVGEISLLTGEARTADVAARSPVRALALSVTDFNAVANVHPHVRILLTNVVADRLGKAAYDGLGGKDLHGYRIVRCVGRGGMGVVYEATRIGTGEVVAVKMLNHSLLYQQGAIDRFTREAETLKSLRHRSIARVYETFFAYGTHFLVMEYCEGSTLKDSIARSGCLDEGLTRKIVGELADALRYLHRQGLVHRDLSPSNVMLTHGAGVKLLDFGLVKDDPTWRDGEAGTRTVSVATVVQGTPAYMAPEQFGRTPVDYRVDVYALACVAYEALTGQPVSRATDLLGMVQEKLRFVLSPPSAIGQGISAEMHGFLLRGLDPQPEKRTVDLDTLAAWADRR